MKKVLGLDLGTTSVGWAFVNQAENENEESSIIKAGVRVNPLSTDEKDAFEKGKAVTTNSDRRLKRSMRRNTQRYKQRRDNLIKIFKEQGWINDETILAENGNFSTFETYKLRSMAATEEVSLEALSRILLMINKKRGYKSSRKDSGGEDGHLLDSMQITKELNERKLTPGQYCLELIKQGKKGLPEFYKSDLQNEFNQIWDFQSKFYPEYLTEEFKEQINRGHNKALSKIFYAKYKITTADNKEKDKKLQEYIWRAQALEKELSIEESAYVLCEISKAIASSSGYLGDISDRSKSLYFNKQTIGQYLYEGLQKDSNFSVKNKIFYRQDYIEEFERIWSKQAEFHKELTEELKRKIQNEVIFYQRKLKSQKGIISFCEFEKREIEIEEDGKSKIKTIGCRTAPVSSPVFQDFRMWQKLNNLRIKSHINGKSVNISLEDKALIAEQLRLKDKMSASDILKLLFNEDAKYYDLNFKVLEGNQTLAAFYSKFKEICSATGHEAIEKTGHGLFGENISIKDSINDIFRNLGFSTDILDFDSCLAKEKFEQQPLFKLWHLLYSYEGDKSKTGDESLIKKIGEICKMSEEYARIISEIGFKQDYGSLSHKAMRKILPYMMNGYEYSEACEKAGYRHSAKSLTKEEIKKKQLKNRLELLPLNSLRNPVVEKILNQVINVVNTVSEEYGKPDEIHIELARELKSSQEERKDATESIAKNNKKNQEIEEKLKESPFNFSYVSKNDIVRYKLYEELKANGYKTFYSNQYIPAEKLFSKEIDIEHIIPQAVLFNDSFSNKTLEYRSVNLEKGKDTALDYIKKKYGEDEVREYSCRVNEALKQECIGKAKRDNLLRDSKNIPEDFINRDLKETQYITKKAKEILEDFVKNVVVTTGSITGKLREDWGLVDVMKELNLPKYDKLGLVYKVTDSNGREIRKINDWSKRNDHRHHAMDAITIAFTKHSHIQYLNNLNAKSDPSSSIYAIANKETYPSGNKRLIRPPMALDDLRHEVKIHLESILVSCKAKNKVMTRNTNVIKHSGGLYKQACLTPRGALHKESVYGLRKRYEVFDATVGAKMKKDVIEQVASIEERRALMARLEEYGGDTKKAFTGANSCAKNPIWIDKEHSRKINEKVKCVRFKEYFIIRKDISPDLNLDKVVDGRIRAILYKRLEEFDNDKKKAFTDLDKTPIWFNKDKGIQLKRVSIAENANLHPMRIKKDKTGQILLKNGKPILNDFVDPQNNHHVAIFKDKEGNLQEHIVKFLEVIDRKASGLPIIDKDYNKDEGWEFLFSMKINEMFVFPNEESGFDPNTIDLEDPRNMAEISPNLFRVQKLSSKYYCFRHHLDTTTEDDKALQNITWKRIQSEKALSGIVKVRVNHIGKIVSVGEYD